MWADEEVLEILLGFAFPDHGRISPHGCWNGSAVSAPCSRPRRPLRRASDASAGRLRRCAGAASESCVQLALLLKAVAQVLQRSLREQIQDRPVIGSWTALLDYLQAAMQHEPAEHFRLLFLDRKNILIRDEVQSNGTVDHTPLYPREVVKRALELGASALIMVHNHPSGDPTPSQADIDMTRQVIGA